MKSAKEIMLQVRLEHERRMGLDRSMQPRLGTLVVVGCAIFGALMVGFPFVGRVLLDRGFGVRILGFVIASLVMQDLFRRRRKVLRVDGRLK